MRGGGARGYTLVELVAVLAVFALVAVMALQMLSGALRSRDALTRADDAGAELMRTLTLLRGDLGALVPVAFHPPAGAPEPALHAPRGAGRAGLSLGGQPRLPGEPGAGLVRAVWDHDAAAGTLSRRVWSSLAPHGRAAEGPAVTMLTGVTGFEIDILGDPDAETGATLHRLRDPDTPLPRGIEVHIAHDRLGPLRIVVAR